MGAQVSPIQWLPVLEDLPKTMCLGVGIEPLDYERLSSVFHYLCIIAVIVGYATTTMTYFTGFDRAVRRV